MANNSPKKKMTDISRPVSIKKEIDEEKIEKRAEQKILEKDLKKIEKEVVQFEKKEEELFKKEEADKKRIRKKLSFWIPISSGILLIILAAAAYVALEVLPRAEIKITTKKTDWDYINPIIASKNVSKFDATQKQIPAEIFSIKKNGTFSFPATGKKYLEKKAGGKITIYNGYSSTPQKLVAGTRFEAPDGKIFRLKETATVPGAQIIEGKIFPSNIEAVINADQAGSQYNIGPVSHFTIPGFKGTPKYEKFYAQSNEVMRGGFVGESVYPTNADIKNAKEKSLANIQDYVKSFTSLQMPVDFKMIEGSNQFNVLKQDINSEVDKKGNFTVFVDAESLNLVFKESDVIDMIGEAAKNSIGLNFKIKSYKIDYGFARVDLSKGQISFAVDFRGILEEPLDAAALKQQILGKKEKDLKNLINSFSNVEKATISFWPFWVKSVPDNINKVKVEVE